VLAKVLREEAPRLRDLRPDLPPALDALVARMLSKDRAARPADGSAVLREFYTLGSIAGGAPVVGVRSAPRLSGGEQRLVSVMLAFVPDELELVEAIVQRHGGEHARLANGAILVTLSGQGSTSEQVLTAAGCALDLREAFPAARIVLAMGRAQTTRGGPPGRVIDQAASLLTQFTSTGIRVDEVTAGLLEARFEIRKGDGWYTLAGRRPGLETPRTLLGKSTPCVGREKELALLEATWRECVEDSVSRAVVVTGPAGQGKSRLRHELVDRVMRGWPHARVLMARADPVGAGSSFLLARQLVRAAAGLREGAPLAEQDPALRTYVARRCEEPDAGRIADFLGELVGVATSDRPSLPLRAARNDPQVMAEWLRRSFREWLAAECAAGPLLVVLEDLHWGDLPSVTYLDGALRELAAKSFMVLALARPEVEATFPGLWRAAEVTQLPLARLTARAAERLVRAVLEEGAPPEVVARIVERAHGNAFFLEELIRHAAGGGARSLPETVVALVQSRFERLPDEARRVVRAASVFGEVFWQGAVGALLAETSHDLDRWLEHLVADDIVIPARESRFSGHLEYAFRHGLLREVAYAMLTQADAVTGHRLAGEWLEAAGEKDALILAAHFEGGGEPRRAIPWLVKAVQAASDGVNLDAVLALGNRGLACNPEPRERAALCLGMFGALILQGDWAAGVPWAREALDLSAVGSASWFECASRLLAAGAFLGDSAISAPLIEQIVSVPIQPEPSGPYGLSVWSSFMALLIMGKVDVARSFLERAEALDKGADDVDPVFTVWLRIARAWYKLVQAEEIGGALTILSDVCALADRTGYAIGKAQALAVCVQAYAWAGDCRRAEDVARELRVSGATLWADWGDLYLSWAWLAVGRLQESIASLESLLGRRDPLLARYARSALAAALARAGHEEAATREGRLLAETATTRASAGDGGLEALAVVALRQGRPRDALGYAVRGLDAASRGGRLQAHVHRLLRAEALHALGATDEAFAAIREARDGVLRVAALIEQPELRESYLTRVINNARTLDLARQWGQE
jgi:tetratricopeptide (TPR) repeat protein